MKVGVLIVLCILAFCCAVSSGVQYFTYTDSAGRTRTFICTRYCMFNSTTRRWIIPMANCVKNKNLGCQVCRKAGYCGNTGSVLDVVPTPAITVA
uniref:Sushi domain-containing protein n=1 Tax=Ciona intestinalis TaxID=7719 RepID=F6R5U5_CIOIN